MVHLLFKVHPSFSTLTISAANTWAASVNHHGLPMAIIGSLDPLFKNQVTVQSPLQTMFKKYYN